jgi:hypothetical protein
VDREDGSFDVGAGGGCDVDVEVACATHTRRRERLSHVTKTHAEVTNLIDDPVRDS